MFEISIQNEGIHFVCRGIVRYAGKVVHETRSFPFDVPSGARADAEAWVASHGDGVRKAAMAADVAAQIKENAKRRALLHEVQS